VVRESSFVCYAIIVRNHDGTAEAEPYPYGHGVEIGDFIQMRRPLPSDLFKIALPVLHASPNQINPCGSIPIQFSSMLTIFPPYFGCWTKGFRHLDGDWYRNDSILGFRPATRFPCGLFLSDNQSLRSS
jgi:hypothetical protein